MAEGGRYIRDKDGKTKLVERTREAKSFLDDPLTPAPVPGEGFDDSRPERPLASPPEEGEGEKSPSAPLTPPSPPEGGEGEKLTGASSKKSAQHVSKET